MSRLAAKGTLKYNIPQTTTQKMEPQLFIIPINSPNLELWNKDTKNDNHSINETIKFMMTYERLTFQTPHPKDFSMFEDHIYNLNNSHTIHNRPMLFYFHWLDYSHDNFHESTLIGNNSNLTDVNKSNLFDINKSSLTDINNSNFTDINKSNLSDTNSPLEQKKRPKNQILLQVFTFNNTIKRKVARLEKLFRSYYRFSNNMLKFSYKFKKIFHIIAQEFWTKLTITWLEWVKTNHNRNFILIKNHWKLLRNIFNDQFAQNFFSIKTSNDCSLNKFASILENTSQERKNAKFVLSSQNFHEFRTFGIWLDLDNGIIIFATALLKEITQTNDYTTIPAGFCIHNISPELLTKKIVLFLNLSLFEFFKSQVC